MKNQLIEILFFWLVAGALSAQELLPFVENFTKSDYYGDNQVWSLAQGNDNAFYFANNNYFLRYNGVRWEKYDLPNKTIIRSVFVERDKVYCGSYNEFGYWKRVNGKMIYTSLSKNKNLFRGISINEEIWKIFKHDDKIYFQSFNELFIYERSKKIKKLRIPFQISYCFVVDNKIYAASIRNGIFLYKNNTFSKVKQWQGLEGNVVHAIAKNKNQTYIFTRKNGVFIEENNRIVHWDNPLNDALKKEIIISAQFIDSNNLAVGTAFKGLYIIDLKANTFRNISRNNSLKNNSVLCIGFDKEKDLWLGLDNGIAHIEINSPLSIYSDNSGLLGSVYTMAALKNGYLLGSNHGIFKYQDKQLQLLPNSQGQVWDIHRMGSSFIIGHNDGTFVYKNGQLNKVNSVSGGWKFEQSIYDSRYYQANYSGIVKYNDPLDFKQYKAIHNFTKPIKNIAQNKPNELWAVDNYKSLYRILFNSSLQVEKVENITQQNRIVNDFGVKLFKYKNEILFFINGTWYSFDAISNKLVLHAIFNANFSEISEIIAIDDFNFIVLKNKLLYVISQIKNQFVWKILPERYYQGKIINHDIKVFRDQNQLLINLDDGFFTFNLNSSKIKPKQVTVEGFYQGAIIDKGTSIDYNQSVEINVVSQYYGYNDVGLFYKFNGDKIFNSISNGKIILNNLSSGANEIIIYYNDGVNYIPIANYTFKVDKPWYFSVFMIIVYILIICGVFYLHYKWNKMRYNEKLKLKEEELRHQKAIIQLEMDAENQLKLQEYQKHILEVQIHAKASEVAGKSLSIAKQTEMIDSILTILESEKDINKLKSSIKKAVKINAINKNEWDIFEKNVFQSNEDFVKRLTTKYPTLTSKDIKLCIYLKMNLSSKEIAPLMGISYRGVELHRYRLRKKIELNPDSSLSKIMINT